MIFLSFWWPGICRFTVMTYGVTWRHALPSYMTSWCVLKVFQARILTKRARRGRGVQDWVTFRLICLIRKGWFEGWITDPVETWGFKWAFWVQIVDTMGLQQYNDAENVHYRVRYKLSYRLRVGSRKEEGWNLRKGKGWYDHKSGR